jgi:hypothetical protein
MACPICQNVEAIEDLSFGGGKRFYCLLCGGFFKISSTLNTLAEGKSYDVERTRERLEAKREAKKQEPQDPDIPGDLEPVLGFVDKDLLIDTHCGCLEGDAKRSVISKKR